MKRSFLFFLILCILTLTVACMSSCGLFAQKGEGLATTTTATTTAACTATTTIVTTTVTTVTTTVTTTAANSDYEGSMDDFLGGK